MPDDVNLISLALPNLPQGNVALNTMPWRAAQSRDCAQVNEGVLLSFAKSLSDQYVEDVSNSLLFGQLAADYQFDRRTAPADWSAVFLTTLSALGWSQTAHSKKTANLQGSVDWAALVVSGMPADVAGLVTASILACGDLAQESKAMRVWNEAVWAPTGSCFLIGSALDIKGGPALSLAIFSFRSKIEKPEFLTWDVGYGTDQSWLRMELNEDVYEKVRSTVIDRLGDAPEYFIVPVPMQR